MATIIRTSKKSGSHRGAAFNFDDMAEQAGHYLDEVRQQAEAMLASARQEADQIRTRAEIEGRQNAQQDAHRVVEQRISETLMPALSKLVIEIQQAKDTWVADWEREVIHLAAAIAEKVIRREIDEHPDITLDLVRESLAMASGSPQIKIRLNSADYDTLGSHVAELVEQVAAVSAAEVVADDSISPGGCRVDSEFGIIDQQIESQIERIKQELT